MSIREQAIVAALIGAIAEHQTSIMASAMAQLGLAMQTCQDTPDLQSLYRLCESYETMILSCASQILGKRGSGACKRRSRRHYRRMAKLRWNKK